MKRASLTIATLALAVSLGACASTTDSGSTDSGSAATSASSSGSKAAPKQHWVHLATIKGSGTKSSDTIVTKGGKIRLIYTFKGATSVGGYVYFLDEGTDLQKDGGIPDVTVDKAGTDQTVLRKSAGKYYLDVMSANASYTIKVAELR